MDIQRTTTFTFSMSAFEAALLKKALAHYGEHWSGTDASFCAEVAERLDGMFQAINSRGDRAEVTP